MDKRDEFWILIMYLVYQKVRGLSTYVLFSLDLGLCEFESEVRVSALDKVFGMLSVLISTVTSTDLRLFLVFLSSSKNDNIFSPTRP